MFLLLTDLFYQQMSFPSQCNKIGVEIIFKTLFLEVTLEAELLLFENYSHSSSILSSKINGTSSVIRKRRSMRVKIKVKIKNRSHRQDINRPNIVNIRSVSAW